MSVLFSMWWPQKVIMSQGDAEGGWGGLEKKFPPCFLPEPAMCFSLLCCVAFFFFPGEQVNLLDSSFRTFSYGCKIRLSPGLSLHFLLFPYRLHGHWSHPESRSSGQRQRPESKDGLCPQKGHSYVYWYRKRLEEAIEFLVNFQNQDIVKDTAVFKQRFSAECPKNSPCSLEINSTKAADSALYFCASSQSTVQHISSS